MTIPLDRLYHYIDSIAEEINSDTVIIYRFSIHGSKKLEDLIHLKHYASIEAGTYPQIYCYDQEPLDYNRYENKFHMYSTEVINYYKNASIMPDDCNLCTYRHVYDRHILIHSEMRSNNVQKYIDSNYFVPVYYWCHALIARDWFRYAEHDILKKNIKKLFLIYNRAWSGTR